MKAIITKLDNGVYNVSVSGKTQQIYKTNGGWAIDGFGHFFKTKSDAVNWICN